MSNAALPSADSDNRSRTAGTAPVVVPIRAGAENDPLAGFASEKDAGRSAASKHGTLPTPARGAYPLIKPALTIVVAAVALVIAGLAAYRYSALASTPKSAAAGQTLSGKVVLNSRPTGVAVSVDGVARGVTPLELELSTGPHDVVFSGETGERRLAVNVEANTRASENVDMPAAGTVSGEIEVTSAPAGAHVTVDNTTAGRTPLKLKTLAPGQHVIEVTSGSNTVTRTVDLSPGGSLNVFVSLAGNATVASGSFAVDSSVELRLIEGGQLLGLSGSAPLTLSVGRHQFEFVNEAFELNLSRTVQVDPGKTTRVSVPMPNGTVFANASPWAEVFIDGRSIGITPLGNIPVAVGSHEIVWRHPQIGERRRTVNVGARTPVRLSMDMTK
jgi:serine/threonine-protein kinase